jgi:probable HAF family extracellular repeat protein
MPGRFRFVSILLVPLLAIPCYVRATPTYSVTSLGSLGGESHPFGINSAGQVVGHATGATYSDRPFLSSGGVMTDLLPAGASSGAAYGINDAGVVVAVIDHRVKTISGGLVTDLGTADNDSAAINSSGQVSYTNQWNGFLYTPGIGSVAMSAAGPTIFTHIHGINDAGTVVGQTRFRPNPDSHAFMYSDGMVRDLGSLAGESAAFAVNESGVAVGYSETPDNAMHAVMFADGQIIDLGAPYSDDTSAFISLANGLNNAGEVVGRYSGGAFLYSGGVMLDLNDLIEPDSPYKGYISTALAINDNHQIAAEVCNYSYNSTCEGVLLTLASPVGAVPELSQYGSFLAGLALLFFLGGRAHRVAGASANRKAARS